MYGSTPTSTLLHVDASLDRAHSNSRRLGARFVQAWRVVHPTGTILRRDLAETPAPPLSEAFVRAVKTPPEKRSAEEREAWKASEALAEEFLSADRYAIGMPMHILTVPSSFKAYVEQIFHEDRVFRSDESGFQGLLEGRKVIFFLSKGADYREGAPLARFDRLESYLSALFLFCGVAAEDITFISVNNALSPAGTDRGDEIGAEDRMRRLASTW